MDHKVGNMTLNLTWTERGRLATIYILHVGKYPFAEVAWKPGTQGKDDAGFCVYPKVPGLKPEQGPFGDLRAAKLHAVRCVEVWFTNATDPAQSPPEPKAR